RIVSTTVKANRRSISRLAFFTTLVFFVRLLLNGP
ncbi:MAG: hypothetical protein ACI9RY_001488, partial [Reinekea sp.]